MSETQICRNCGQGIFVMIRKNTGFCSELCAEEYVEPCCENIDLCPQSSDVSCREQARR